MEARKFNIGDVVHIRRGLEETRHGLCINRDMVSMSRRRERCVVDDVINDSTYGLFYSLRCSGGLAWNWLPEWIEESSSAILEGDIVVAANDRNKVVSIKNGFIGRVKEVVDGDKVKVETIRCFNGAKRCYIVKNENLKIPKIKEETIMEILENGKVVCACCGKEIGIEDIAGKDEEGNFICCDCSDSYYVECDCCGCLVKCEDSYVTIDCETICESCKEEYYVECEDCGELVHNDDAIEVTTLDGSNYFICRDCRDNGDYHYCCECNDLFHENDMECDNYGDWYCKDHYHEHLILDYHDFSDWENHYVDKKNESTLKGFELEVENSKDEIENDEMAEIVQELMGDFIVFEHDGSLDNGFENISNPFTMPWLYKNEGKIKEMLEEFKDNGFTSHNKGTCGLHIHVNKSQLETSERSIDDVISNILIILETFKDELITFSRRKEYEVNRWAAFYTKEEQLSYKLVNKKKVKDGDDRYHVLNLSNWKTIEFRIFRGTLKFESFMSCIELVDNIVEIAKNEAINGLSWDDIISYAGKYVKDYSQNDRRIVSHTKVNIVPDPICPLKLGCIVRTCDYRGEVHVGKIDFLNELQETFELEKSSETFYFEDVVKNFILVRGDVILIQTSIYPQGYRPAKVLGYVDDLIQVRTFNEEGEEVVEAVSFNDLYGTRINCWNYERPLV